MTKFLLPPPPPTAGNFPASVVFFDTTAATPGQPIPFEWNALSFLNPVTGATANAYLRIYIPAGNVLLYESPAVPWTVSGILRTTPSQTDVIQAPSTGGAANALYHVGSPNLRLDILNDAKMVLYSEPAVATIIPESVSGNWWVWSAVTGTADTTSVPPSVPLVQIGYDSLINNAYRLSGNLVNNCVSPNTAMTGTAVLVEVDDKTGTSVDIQSVPFTLTKGQQQEIDFNPITKNWAWLIKGVWIINPVETLIKSYTYTVRFSMSDQYGNIYSNTISSIKAKVSVTVSSDKKWYQSGALAVLGAGAVAAIFTFGAAWGAAVAIANGLGAKAMDPPQPDPDFDNTVDLGEASQGLRPPDQNPLPALWDILAVIYKIVDLVHALGIVEGRILGARRARNRAAFQKQCKAYIEGDRRLSHLRLELMKAAQIAIDESNGNPALSRDALQRQVWLWQLHGIPNYPAGNPDAKILQDQNLRILPLLSDQTFADLVTSPATIFATSTMAAVTMINEIHQSLPNLTSPMLATAKEPSLPRKPRTRDRQKK